VLDDLRPLIASFYPYLKAIHVFSAALWSFSTVVAWIQFLKPALVAARRNPGDEALRARRNEAMRRFDRGAVIEHVALVVLIITAGLMLWVGGFDLTRLSYVTGKVWLGILVILPMEAIDIYLSHLGGNKDRLLAAGDSEHFERIMHLHWIFFRVTEPIIVVLIPITFFIAIVKPF